MQKNGCTEGLLHFIIFYFFSLLFYIFCFFLFVFVSLPSILLTYQQFIAKAFLEKDYEAIRAREAAPQPAEDVAMNDVDQNITAAQVQPSPPQIQPQSEPQPVEKAPTSPEKVDLKKEEPSATEPQTGTTTDPQPSEEVPVKEEENDPGATSLPDQGMAGAEGINFDSVLNDTGGGNSFDLNLDFGNDDMGNQAFLSGSTFGGPLPDTEKPNTSNPAETSIPTPSGGGAFDMELQKSDTGANMFPEQGTGADEMMGPGESNFDDLFMETENFGEGGDLNHLEGDSLMNISELDDNWFS